MATEGPATKITVMSIFANDQDAALAFHTEKLGFLPAADGIPFTSFGVPDGQTEYDRMVALDGTVSNLIRIAAMAAD